MAAEAAPLISPEPNESNTKFTADLLPTETSNGAPNGLIAEPARQLSPQDAMDFLLHPMEIARGRAAAENYLSACRNEETHSVPRHTRN